MRLGTVAEPLQAQAVAKKTIQQRFVISPEELAALEEWRARHKVWSRSEAIREAIRRMVSEPTDR